jgi:Uma2 family endonuclease
LETFPELPYWKYELIEGTLIVSPNAPSLRHQTCVLSLGILFRQICPPELQAVIAPFDYTPGPRLAFQPDVLIARRPIGVKRLEQVPVLVVEVLSPSNRLVDKRLKRQAYEKNGIEHYWIVDPAGPSIQALQLVDGAYAVIAEAAAGEKFEVKVPIQVSFDPWVLLDE